MDTMAQLKRFEPTKGVVTEVTANGKTLRKFMGNTVLIRRPDERRPSLHTYGIKRGCCGVYALINLTNGKCYIGSSSDVSMRLGTHYGREARKSHLPLHKDILSGLYEFGHCVIEECNKKDLLCREYYYQTLLQPEYNVIIAGNMSDENKAKYYYTDKVLQARIHLKKLYNTKSYRVKFREKLRFKFRPVRCIQTGAVYETITDCAMWINPAAANSKSKVKEVCDGIRKSYKGFTFEWYDGKCND